MKKKLFTFLGVLFMYYGCLSQKVVMRNIAFDYPAPYTVFDMLGHVMKQGYGTTISFSDYPNGNYIVVADHNPIIVVVHEGYVLGMRAEIILATISGLDTNQVCIRGTEEERPFHDTASLIAYIKSRIDTCTTDSAMMCELTRFATEWYPQALHATWVQGSWQYSMNDICKHFLQIDKMGMCGDQAVFLSNFLFYLRGLRSCGLGMGHANSDSAGNGASHVQLIVELPVGTDPILAIFDSQNGIVYRDSLGNIIDFRDIFKKVKKPLANEMKPRGRMYNVSPCHGKEYSTTFPFNTLEVYKSEFHPVDTILLTGERSLSFSFSDSSSWTASWRNVGESHGYNMDSVSAKQMADMMPLFANAIWETVDIGLIPENVSFAKEVRKVTNLQLLSAEDFFRRFKNLQPKRE